MNKICSRQKVTLYLMSWQKWLKFHTWKKSVLSVHPFHMSRSNLRNPWPIHFKFHRVIGIDGLTVCILYGEILIFHSRVMGKKVFTNIVWMLTMGVSCTLGAAVYYDLWYCKTFYLFRITRGLQLLFYLISRPYGHETLNTKLITKHCT
jgi:hypothetical protein